MNNARRGNLGIILSVSSFEILLFHRQEHQLRLITPFRVYMLGFLLFTFLFFGIQTFCPAYNMGFENVKAILLERSNVVSGDSGNTRKSTRYSMKNKIERIAIN